MSATTFLYCACQVGAEAALKQAVVEEHPTWRPAFARPGLVTFKVPDAAGSQVPSSSTPLGRVWGRSLGPARDVDTVYQAVRTLGLGSAARLHVWERDRYKPGDEPSGFEYGPAAALVYEALDRNWPQDLPRCSGQRARAGDPIVDVVVGTADEPWLVGTRRLGDGAVPWPGARIPVEPQPDAPSRAYYKLEEALAWSQAPVRSGDVVVELGSAPGGASHALLRRGLMVHGIDPGAMDPRVLEFCGAGGNRFTHHACRMSEVGRGDLPRRLHWVISDVNLAPQIALQTIRRLAAKPRDRLCGVLATFKLDDWKALRHVPGWMRQLEAMGMVQTGVTQLPRNRMELFAFGLTSAGAARIETLRAGRRQG
ncbi:MAG: hypothetical protein K0V04_15370 [Deltaproteobacteria bacterium]|nr:hypothetical protein [Deltaproteobacteria bacterium]